MKNIFTFNFHLLFIFYLLFGQVFFSKAENISQELTGNIIYYDKCNDIQYPVKNAFDNNLNTYFRSCAPFGNWVGLDLKEKYIITKIAYAPRMDSDYRERLQLAVFQGANNPDFGDAVNLFMIPGLTERQLTEQEIVCTKGFRYVRLVLPYAQDASKSSYVGELKFYGYKGDGNNSKLPQITNLPTVSIHTVNTEDITSQEIYVKGIISVIYANGTKIQTDSLEIRGRGNNSWTHPKKPYRLKLFKSANLMDLPAKAKNWTLINSYGDKTLMRNILAFDFSRRLEMPYTSPAEAVDVVLNGDYKGCYQLSDHIDVRKNRVDVEEMTATDLTGGYMVEIDAYAYQNPPEPKKFKTSQYNMPVTIKYPDEDEIVLAQEQYIETYFNKLTSAVSGNQYKDIENGFRKYLDVESFLRHFLVGEYSGNTDTYWSVRMWKKRTDDKFYFGPVWDFDLGFDNDNRTYPIMARSGNSNQWLCFSNESSAAGSTKDFVKRIMSDEKMEQRLKEIYSYYRDKNVISKQVLQEVVDDNADFLEQSQQMNFKRWPIMNKTVHMNPVIWGSYNAEVENVKNYISQRIDWMDKKLNYIPGANDIKKTSLPGINIITGKNTIRFEVLSDSYLIIIRDICGNKIMERKIFADSDFDLKSGVYLIMLKNENNQHVIKSIVP